MKNKNKKDKVSMYSPMHSHLKDKKNIVLMYSLMHSHIKKIEFYAVIRAF